MVSCVCVCLSTLSFSLWVVLSASEASSNLARYQGINFSSLQAPEQLFYTPSNTSQPLEENEELKKLLLSEMKEDRLLSFVLFVCLCFITFCVHLTDKASWRGLQLEDFHHLLDEVQGICEHRSRTHGLMSFVRTLKFGDEVVRRILLGTLALSRDDSSGLYKKAKNCQLCLTKEMNQVYFEEGVDFILWFALLFVLFFLSTFAFPFPQVPPPPFLPGPSPNSPPSPPPTLWRTTFSPSSPTCPASPPSPCPTLSKRKKQRPWTARDRLSTAPSPSSSWRPTMRTGSY